MHVPCAVTRAGSSRGPRRAVPSATTSASSALARWFDRFEAVIEHHHHCEDEIVWPGLEGSSPPADCGAEGSAFLVARRDLLDDHQELDTAMGAVRTSLREGSSDRRDAARRFEACLDEHLTREEAALFPLLLAHVSEEEFAVLEEAVLEATSLGAMTFTVPWIMDERTGRPVRQGRATGCRRRSGSLTASCLQPRYRRLVAAATGVYRS